MNILPLLICFFVVLLLYLVIFGFFTNLASWKFDNDDGENLYLKQEHM